MKIKTAAKQMIPISWNQNKEKRKMKKILLMQSVNRCSVVDENVFNVIYLVYVKVKAKDKKENFTHEWKIPFQI